MKKTLTLIGMMILSFAGDKVYKIDRHLDRKGERINHRLDNRGERLR